MSADEKLEGVCEAYNAAIEYTLARTDGEDRFSAQEALYFLGLWHEGCWEELAEMFPSFDLSSATACGYVE